MSATNPDTKDRGQRTIIAMGNKIFSSIDGECVSCIIQDMTKPMPKMKNIKKSTPNASEFQSTKPKAARRVDLKEPYFTSFI